MSAKTDIIYQQLRDHAEARIEGSESSPLPSMAEADLLHELQVYQIELEMQNEELRRTQLALAESRDRYLDLYEFAPVGYLTLNSQGIITDTNLTAATLLGVSRGKLIKHSFTFCVAREAIDEWTQHFLHCKRKADKHSFELLLHRHDGTNFCAYLDCHIKQNKGEAPSLRITLTDISTIKQAESQLRIAASVFKSQQGIMVTDQHQRIVAVNRSFTNITGYDSDEVLDKTPHILHSGRHTADFYRSMWNSIHETGMWKGEIWNRRKNGDIYPELLQITAVQDGYDRVSHYVATFDDITLSKLAQDEIESLAFYDPLTSLPNRRYLLTRLQEALMASNRNHKYGAILFIDVDNLKYLNDTHGHDAGDKLLQQVAQRLETCVRGNDTIARLGGDEFVVMLTNLSEHSVKAASQAEQTGEQILAALNQVYSIENYRYESSVSIGVMLFNGQEHSVNDLLKEADIAMYQAKQAGRNNLCFFDPEMRAVIAARSKLEEDLQLAIAEQQFQAYYQPQVDYTGKIIGAEILIRWQHPTLGLLMPADFIPLAEDTALILPIANWILETACAQIKQWEKHRHTQNLYIAVNISCRQLQQSDFVEQVRSILDKTAINPSKLKLELTESTALKNVADTICKMKELNTTGTYFSMDDFGTGYSSLSYLTKLPFKQIKIDQSIIHNIDMHTTDALMIQAIIGVAKELDMGIIAEAVETEDQRAFLQSYGCLLYQGCLFSPPLPIDLFEQLLLE